MPITLQRHNNKGCTRFPIITIARLDNAPHLDKINYIRYN